MGSLVSTGVVRATVTENLLCDYQPSLLLKKGKSQGSTSNPESGFIGGLLSIRIKTLWLGAGTQEPVGQ